MLNSELSTLPSSLPEGFSRDYDAHIYYELGIRELAARLREKAASSFESAPVFVGALRDEKVGPHPMPMFELNFPRQFLAEMLSWLDCHRQGLTVLVHRVTGNDAADHSEGAIWLGKPVPLDESKFDP